MAEATHRAHYRPLYRTRDLWSVGCSCGWLCDHPLRGGRERAQQAWQAHRAEAETDALDRLMRHTPKP